MIRTLDDMPAGVIGLEGVGAVARDDYARVIVPAIEEAIAELESAKSWAAGGSY